RRGPTAGTTPTRCAAGGGCAGRARSRNHFEGVVITAFDHGRLRLISGDGDNNVPSLFRDLRQCTISALKWSIGRLACSVSDDNERELRSLSPFRRNVEMIRNIFAGPWKRIGSFLVAFRLVLRIFRIRLWCLCERQDRSCNQSDERRNESYSHSITPVPPTETVLMFVNDRMPCVQSSRPNPEALIPPKGSRESDRVMEFTKTIPDSIWAARRFARSILVVQREALNPNRLLLAVAIASASSLTRMTAATGPNVSSSNAAI